MSENHQKEFTIIVNGREKKVPGAEVSYTQIVNLAYNNSPPTGQDVVITVTYSKGDLKGTLVMGQSVPVKNGMIFDVSATNRS